MICGLHVARSRCLYKKSTAGQFGSVAVCCLLAVAISLECGHAIMQSLLSQTCAHRKESLVSRVWGVGLQVRSLWGSSFRQSATTIQSNLMLAFLLLQSGSHSEGESERQDHGNEEVEEI